MIDVGTFTAGTGWALMAGRGILVVFGAGGSEAIDPTLAGVIIGGSSLALVGGLMILFIGIFGDEPAAG